MNYNFVKNVVDSLNLNHTNFTDNVFDGNLPKAIDNAILEMCCDGRYKILYFEFDVLIEARNQLNRQGYIGKVKL